MKKQNLWKEFLKLGAMTAGSGPLIMALVYAGLQAGGVVETVTVSELVLGILTSLVLAFIAGGIGVIWRIEKLPLMWASLLHGSVLFLDYLVIYLVNGWMPCSLSAVGLFAGVFILIYFLIWCCVYWGIRQSVKKMNASLTRQ